MSWRALYTVLQKGTVQLVERALVKGSSDGERRPRKPEDAASKPPFKGKTLPVTDERNLRLTPSGK